nr:YlxR family protein [Actinosynnema mirum]
MAGALAPDPRRRLPGRGAWLHPDPSCLRTAEKRRAFPRALKVTGELDAEGVRAHLEQFGSTAAGSPRGRQQVKEAGRPVMSQP